MATEQNGDDARLTGLDDATWSFVEDFATSWVSTNNSRMDGRVLALLIIVDEPYLSSARIAELLRASTGAVSTATRSLVSVGFLKRHSVPGDRSHYFRVEDDVWGNFLSGEREYLRRMKATVLSGMSLVDAAGPRTRLRNAERYMTWLEGYHRKMLADWEAFRDAPEDDPKHDDPKHDDPKHDDPETDGPEKDDTP